MNNLDHQFHRAQQRIKTRSVGFRSESRPLFQPELAGIEAKDNLQRLFAYRQKLQTLGAVA